MTGQKRDPSQQWAIRLERIRRYRERSNPTGMTRPPRDPDEREFLRPVRKVRTQRRRPTIRLNPRGTQRPRPRSPSQLRPRGA
jgi:hypothetical protein